MILVRLNNYDEHRITKSKVRQPRKSAPNGVKVQQNNTYVIYCWIIFENLYK